MVAFAVSMAGFGPVPQQFFPSSDRSELLVDVRLQEGASFAATLRQVERLEKTLEGRPEIEHSVSFVGTGAPRFYLPLDQQLATPNFAQLVITAHSVEDRESWPSGCSPCCARIPAIRTRLSRLENGPPVGFQVQFRVSGDQIAEVRAVAEQVAAEVRAYKRSTNVQFDWDEPSERSVRFEIDQQKARELGIASSDVSDFLAMTLSGYAVTQYRERDKLITVSLRAPQEERIDPARLATLAMPTPNGPVPLGSLGHVRYDLEYGVIWERDRQPTITVQADVTAGAQGLDVTRAIDAKLDAVRAELPVGYRIEVGGPVEESGKGQSSINAQMPLMAVAVLTLLMVQLQSFARVLMVVLTAPLGLIGVVAALLIFGKPFGFVAMLGVIAMFGMIMRNSVILIDQIQQDIGAGHKRVDAIVGATVRRFRPITLTAAAAVLALIPLLRSNFFGPMATALMGGITSATVLTLFFLPALYAAWFRVRHDERDEPEGVPPGANAGDTAEREHEADDDDPIPDPSTSVGRPSADAGPGRCAFAPDGKPPAVGAPAQYGVARPPRAPRPRGGAALRTGRPAGAEWWKRFMAPPRSTLVEEGLAHSPDLAAAERNLAGAREQLRGQVRLVHAALGGRRRGRFAQARAHDAEPARADGPLQRVHRADPRPVRPGPVRRGALRQPVPGRSGGAAGIPARIRSALAGRQHRHRRHRRLRARAARG